MHALGDRWARRAALGSVLAWVALVGVRPLTAGEEPGNGLSGVVRDSESKPVAKVAIVGTKIRTEVDFRNGVLSDFERPDRPYAATDADGRFQFAPQNEPFGVFAYHAGGYSRKSAQELAQSSDLTLEPWGRIEGNVTVLGKPLAGVTVRITLDATDEHSMFYDVFDYEATTDERGRFAVEHVPAGIAHAWTDKSPWKVAEPNETLSSPRKLIKAGETLQLNVGGGGRPVIGKLHAAGGIPPELAGGRLVVKSRYKRTAPDPPADVAAAGGEKLFYHYFNFYRSPEGRASRLAERIYAVEIERNGAFRAMEVPPGLYTLTFWFGNDSQHPVAARKITVPTADPPTTDPLDVGTVEVEPPRDK